MGGWDMAGDARLAVVLPFVGGRLTAAVKLLECLDGDLAGVAELAIDAGVSKQVVHNWAKRDETFPGVVRQLAATPVYSLLAFRAYRRGIDTNGTE